MAEMTGRKGRVVADQKGRGVYTLRANPDSHEMDSLNVHETGEAGRFFLQITMLSAPATAITSCLRNNVCHKPFS